MDQTGNIVYLLRFYFPPAYLFICIAQGWRRGGAAGEMNPGCCGSSSSHISSFGSQGGFGRVVKIALSSGAAALLQPWGRKQGRKGTFPLLSYLHGAGGDVF